MKMTDLDCALDAFRSAERRMGAERRKDEKGLPTDKAATTQAKRQAAQQVLDAASNLVKVDTSPSASAATSSAPTTTST